MDTKTKMNTNELEVMNERDEKYNETTFENIKHIDEYGNEYWLAREKAKGIRI